MVEVTKKTNLQVDNLCVIRKAKGTLSIHPRLDLVNMVVRPLLFTKLSLFTKSIHDKKCNMKNEPAVYSSN